MSKLSLKHSASGQLQGFRFHPASISWCLGILVLSTSTRTLYFSEVFVKVVEPCKITACTIFVSGVLDRPCKLLATGTATAAATTAGAASCYDNDDDCYYHSAHYLYDDRDFSARQVFDSWTSPKEQSLIVKQREIIAQLHSQATRWVWSDGFNLNSLLDIL